MITRMHNVRSLKYLPGINDDGWIIILLYFIIILNELRQN